MRNPLSDRPIDWPRLDPNGFIFLGRAMEKIGAGLFGDDWISAWLPRPVGIVRPTGRPMGAAPPDEVRYAKRLIEEFRPELVPDPYPGRTGILPPPWDMDATIWTVAEALRKEMHDAHVADLKRRRDVRDAVTVECEAGRIKAAVRHETGKMVPISAHQWNVSGIEHFVTLQMRPIEHAYQPVEPLLLFLDAADVDRFVAQLTRPPVPAGIDFHLSPYLAEMLAACRHYKITPDHQPKAIELERHFRQCRIGRDGVSENLARAMATLIREPESQRGRGRK